METNTSRLVPNPYYPLQEEAPAPSLGNKQIRSMLNRNGVLSSDASRGLSNEIKGQFQNAQAEREDAKKKLRSRLDELSGSFMANYQAYNTATQEKLQKFARGEGAKEEIENQQRATQCFEESRKVFEAVCQTIMDKCPANLDTMEMDERIRIEMAVLGYVQVQNKIAADQDQRDVDGRIKLNTNIGAEVPRRPHDHHMGHPINVYGRQLLLATLYDLCFTQVNWNRQQSLVKLVLRGELGGGATELARCFAIQQEAKLGFSYFIRANSEETLNQDYIDMALRLRLKVNQRESPAETRAKVHIALSARKAPFLLIYDGLRNPIELPQGGGIILIPSSHYAVDDPLQLIPVPSLDEVSVREILNGYLARRQPPENPTDDSLRTLTNLFSGNALLIDMAGRYLVANPQSTLATLCTEIAKRDEVHPVFTQHHPRYNSDYRTAFNLLLGKIKRENPDAHLCLEISAYLNPHRISFAFFRIWLGREELRQEELNGIINILVKYVGIRINEDRESFSMLPFKQLLVRKAQNQEGGKAALNILSRFLNENEEYFVNNRTEIYPFTNWAGVPQVTLLEGRLGNSNAVFTTLRRGRVAYRANNDVKIATLDGACIQTIQCAVTAVNEVYKILELTNDRIGIKTFYSFDVFDQNGHRLRQLACGHVHRLRDGQICLIGLDRSFELWEERGYYRDRRGNSSTLEIWNEDLSSLRIHSKIPHGKRNYSLLAESLTGSLLTPMNDRELAGWRRDGNCNYHLIAHEGLIHDTAMLRDGTVASASADGTIKLWRGEEGPVEADPLEVFGGGHGPVVKIRELRDGVIAGGYEDGLIRLWKRGQGCIQTLRGHGGRIYKLEEMDNGTLATESDTAIRLFRRDGTTVFTLNGCDMLVVNHRTIAYKSLEDHSLRLLTFPTIHD